MLVNESENVSCVTVVVPSTRIEGPSFPFGIGKLFKLFYLFEITVLFGRLDLDISRDSIRTNAFWQLFICLCSSRGLPLFTFFFPEIVCLHAQYDLSCFTDILQLENWGIFVCCV